jgi:predicted naringenin-chalcone synthase
MHLVSLATAFPPHIFTQQECHESIASSASFDALKPRSRDLLGRILLGDSGIQTRHFCESDLPRLFTLDAGGLHRHFEHHAPRLAADALGRACEKAGVAPSEIDALLVCTCTGYLCPGPSSHLAELLGIRHDAFLQDLLGLGCGAALPMLEAARGVLAADPTRLVATVAVEICSAAFYLNDEPGVLVSLCLFGDGAAAALWRAEGDGPRFANFATTHLPAHREKIRFVNANGRLKNQLHRDVPVLAAKAVSELYQRRATDPAAILAHTGGRDVLDAIERAIPAHPLDESREVLRDRGNVSSPCVLAALENRLGKEQAPGPLWLTAFGAGFAAHSAELLPGLAGSAD